MAATLLSLACRKSVGASWQGTAARWHVDSSVQDQLDSFWDFQPVKVTEKWSHGFSPPCQEYHPSSGIQHWLESINEWSRDPSGIQHWLESINEWSRDPSQHCAVTSVSFYVTLIFVQCPCNSLLYYVTINTFLVNNNNNNNASMRIITILSWLASA